ncbi:synaptosomal-associated protein 25-A-like [Octopus sinensis]|uniref:Synaptosomal-associated protein 25-A-like n=1 Tax=Octopus sinensis TaxID=2607531 RepID=A0A6P7TPC8_9MOLL|nr:synaptosomal-associated protein 25-A-like [Octopus sinensis]
MAFICLKKNSLRQPARMSSKNPFLNSSDDEDYKFGNTNKAKAETRRSELLDQAKSMNQRKIESTQRTLALINESEVVGISTAEVSLTFFISQQLSQQGEQLRNIDAKLGMMDENLNESQKNLNGMNSFFRSFFSPKKSKISSTTVNQKNTESKSSFVQNDPPQIQTTGTSDLDDNLGMIASGIGRLKGLAIGLNDEIDQQNKDLVKLNSKTAKIDLKLSSQQAQIKKII